MSTVERLLTEVGARIVEKGPPFVAIWRGLNVRPASDAESPEGLASLAALFAALDHLPDPVPTAEVHLRRREGAREANTFVPILARKDADVARALAGDSFLIVLDRDSGSFTVVGEDRDGRPLSVENRQPKVTVGHDDGLLVNRSIGGDGPVRTSAEDRARKLERLIPILACVRCPARAGLERDGDRLACVECSTHYPIIDGTPILLRDASAEFEAGEAPVSSNTYSRQAVALIEEDRERWVLDCGSGQPQENVPHVIHLERLRFANVDVVASAEELPFASGALGAVICEAVLEHVRDPWVVCEEFHRTLRAGAPVYVDVPFLAPFHAYPDHYQNFTQRGLERLLEDFEPIESGIGPHQEPWLALAWMLRLAREGLPDDAARDRLDRATIREILEQAAQMIAPDVLHPLSDAARRTIAAGFFFLGRKPG